MFQFTFIIITLLAPAVALSHSGGLNSSGCHAGSKPYHCHRSASEMTKNSSGGYRLKCSAGSTSKDCSNATSASKTNVPSLVNESAEYNSDAIGPPLTSGVSNADGEAITLLGFNYDQPTDEAIRKLSLRFNCSDWFMNQKQKCSADPSVVSWSLDAVENISSITFRCEAFDGCTYSADEIFDALVVKYKITDNTYSDTVNTCGSGIAGELVCVNKYTKSLSLQRDKFRQKPLNFD